MTFEEIKGKFDSIAQSLAKELEAKSPAPPVPPASEAAEVRARLTREELHALVPEALQKEAFEAAMGLSEDEAFLCVNRLDQRNGIRQDFHDSFMTFFGHPLWTPLFAKAKPAAARKAAQKSGT